MKNILTVFKKEVDRVFKDKRLIITLFILPGLFIFLIYNFIGNALENMQEGDVVEIALVNPTGDFEAIYETGESNYETNLKIREISEDDIDDYKALIDEEDWNIIIAFPEDLEAYDGSGDNPSVLFYTNPKDAANAIDRFSQYLVAYDQQLRFETYGDTTYMNIQYQQSPISERELIGTVMSSLLPMLVIMFLFSGAMSIGPESIAGEKERNTISTLLITPIKRSELAIGKILSLSALSLLSSLSSFIGIIFSLPALLNLENQSLSVFSFNDYLLIFFVLASTIFVIIGIVSVVSAYARTLKEATTYITPIYILTIVVSITTMFSTGSNTNIFAYLIPIYNAVQSLVGIMTFTENVGVFVLVTALSNFVYMIGFIYLLNQMFNSEQIMFNK
jgi:sodium transport system permease protein